MGNICGSCCDNGDGHSYQRASSVSMPSLQPQGRHHQVQDALVGERLAINGREIQAQQQRLKLQQEKERKQEELRIQQEKEEREKLRIQQEKEEREKLRIQQEKEEREKLRIQQEKEEREKLRLQQEKKKRENLRLQQEQITRLAERQANKQREVQLLMLQEVIKQEKEKRERLTRLQEQERIKQEKLKLEQEQNKQLQKTTSKYVNSNPDLIKEFLKGTEFDTWCSLLATNSPYSLITPNVSESYEIKGLFMSTNKKCFRVNEIKKVINPYLMMQYKLMKDRCRKLYGRVTERILFHGTREANIDGICKNNFNWRLRGSALGHKFGQGISFSPISNYATHYSDKTYNKIMFVANVIVSNSCLGNQFTIIPPENCDTTTNEKEHVIVKYEDNTFYPCYIIYYQGFDSSKKSKRFY